MSPAKSRKPARKAAKGRKAAAKRAGAKKGKAKARPASAGKAAPRPAKAAARSQGGDGHAHCAASDPFGDPCQNLPRRPSKYCVIHSYLER